MTNQNKISLFTAILININIMIGAGVFMNTGPLTKYLGLFGFTSYIASAILLLPIVLTIAKLAQTKAVAGGLYVYNKEILGESVGFLGGWSYFLGKTTSAGLLIHVFVTFFWNKINLLQSLPILFWDAILIFALIFLNILGLRLGGKIQYFFASAKFIPLIFVIFASASLFNPNLFIITASDIQNIFLAIPVAVYALISFEIITSVGHMVENPKKNIKRVILYSFLIVALINIAVQFFIYFALNKELLGVNIPVLLLGTKIFAANSHIPGIINASVFASILGGSFGVFSSNCWNLYALANDNNFPFKKLLTKININNVPYISTLIQGVLASIFLAISQNQVTLQSMVIFGVAIAYFLSSVSLFKLIFLEKTKKFLLPSLAILSSSYLVFLCIKRIIESGVSFPFIAVFLFGIILAVYSKLRK